jgi:DNA gyrase subunit B
MYFGCNTERGVVYAVNELVSNGIDQFLHGNATHVALNIDGDTIHYQDDGPGLPYDVPGPDTVSLAEQYLTCHHTTATADGHAPHVHILGHGLGLVCVNAASEQFNVKTWRSGRLWEQDFAQGIPIAPPRIVKRGKGKGTQITFCLDSAVFKVKVPCPQTMRRLIFEAAHLFPGIMLSLGREVFHAPNGLSDLAGLYLEDSLFQSQTPFGLRVRSDDVDVHVGIVGESTNPHFRSWANGSCTARGTHVDGLRDALRAVNWSPAIAMIHVVMHEPEFAGPTKCILATPHVHKIVSECVEPALRRWRDRK